MFVVQYGGLSLISSLQKMITSSVRKIWLPQKKWFGGTFQSNNVLYYYTQLIVQLVASVSFTVPICDCLGWNLCMHLNICWMTPIHFAALEDISEPPQEAGKRKIGEPSDAPLTKWPCTALRKVPSLRVDWIEPDHTMPRIPPLSRQQSLYMIEGFRMWTTGVQPFTTVSHWIDRWHFMHILNH